MILIGGLIILIIVFGTVKLTCLAVDYINKKYHKNIDYLAPVYVVFLIEILIIAQIIYG